MPIFRLYNKDFKITQNYSSCHNGMDLVPNVGNVLGAPVPFSGTRNGTIVYKGTATGYGNVLVIKHADGTGSLYAHLHTAGTHLQLKKGNIVKPGQIIANIGKTGKVTGPHLHYERLSKATVDAIAKNAGNGRLGVASSATRLKP